jgi:uncharacterized membrane protein
MKTILRLEELAGFLFSIYLFSLLSYPWWMYLLFFLSPDLSMLGYAAGPRVGAFIYNLVHHKAVSFGLITLGGLLSVPLISLAGAVLLGHSNLDRAVGYGLKHTDSFKHTHLGAIGRETGTFA